jgi:nitrogen-specific signal transduction histidine kinase/ActR/RegA family two-component response regulator
MSMTLVANNEHRAQPEAGKDDQRLADERLTRSEKFESIGRLAGGIAHDFNNLLTAILGYTDLLLSERSESDPDRADLEEIQKAGRRAAVLTQQLLAFSRRQVLMPEDVDLGRTLTGLREMLTRLVREDIAIVYDVPATPATVHVDPAQIEQVIVNLVLNARDGLAPSGRIEIGVARVARSEIELPPDAQATPAEYIRLRVSDDGAGISPEAQLRLFEPFFAAKELGRGTGLGLASVYGIVRQSGGFIKVTSQNGTGTTIAVYFPEASPVSANTPGRRQASDLVDGNETILLVEDEDAVRAIVMAVLSRQGYRVLEAPTPAVACDLFDRYGDEIDMLLTDVVMPGMNGPALAQQLVGRQPGLKVLFISGYADLAVTLDANNPNVSFLSKPFQAAALSARVRDILNRPARVVHEA